MLDSSLYSIPARLIIGSPLPVALKEPDTSALGRHRICTANSIPYSQCTLASLASRCWGPSKMWGLINLVEKCKDYTVWQHGWWCSIGTILNADKIILKMGKHTHTTTVPLVVLDQGSRVGTQVELKFEKKTKRPIDSVITYCFHYSQVHPCLNTHSIKGGDSFL